MSNVRIGGRQVGIAPAHEQVEAPRVERRGGPLQPELRPIGAEEIAQIGGAQVEQRQVRVRFAPSPTGHLHIGGARTALMNYLFAQKMGGEFVLRIEDTDQLRSRPEYTEAILDGLRWLKMNWVGKPIYQSQRADLYTRKVQQLLDEDKAYKDPKGSGAVYFKMPEQGVLTVQDGIKGLVQVPVADADGSADYVIQRSDGAPTFLLANVVDDGDQGITHVLRGDDHLTNAARQIPLFKALGYEPPKFYHMPLIHGDPTVDPATGEVTPGGKLSKRHGATSVIDYQAQGYDAEVLMNHLARMGVRYETEQTVPIAVLAQQFDPLNMSKSPSTLGIDRLDGRMMMFIKSQPTDALVGEIKSRLADEAKLKAHLEDAGTGQRPGFFERTGVTAQEARAALEGVSDRNLEALAEASRGRASSYAEMLDLLVFLRAAPIYSEDERPVQAAPKKVALLDVLARRLAELPEERWTSAELSAQLEEFNDSIRLNYAAYSESLRWMLTGLTEGVPTNFLLGILGKEAALERIRAVIDA